MYCTDAFVCVFQGIDIKHNKDRKVHRKEPKSEDIYLRLLVKVWTIDLFSPWLSLCVTTKSLFALMICSCIDSWLVVLMLPSTRSFLEDSSWARPTARLWPCHDWWVQTSTIQWYPYTKATSNFYVFILYLIKNDKAYGVEAQWLYYRNVPIQNHILPVQ